MVPVNVNPAPSKPVSQGLTRTVGDFPRLQARASLCSRRDHSFASVARSRNSRHSIT